MAQTPKEGDLIAGKYRVESVLGEGGMGVVVAAFRTDLDQKVAIKVLNDAALKNPLILQRFEREARAMVKIQSRHVARVSDVGKLENGAPFMVMEFLEGRDLSKLIEEGLPPVDKAVDYVLEACDAVAEAHAHGVVHRDLKPGNLYLAEQPDGSIALKVLDFGISKSIGSDKDEADKNLTKTTDVFGSPMYMSPEQLLSTASVDHRTDIWALGIILYELLTGEPPFHVGTVAEIWSAILDKQVPLPSLRRPDLARDLEDVVMRCLARDVDARYQTVGDLAEALAPFGTGEAKASVDRAKRFKKGLRGGIPDAAGSSPGFRAVPAPTPSSPGGPTVPTPSSSSPGSAPERAIPKPPPSKPRLELSQNSDDPDPPEKPKPRPRAATRTSTDWQTHEMPKRSAGGALATVLIVGVLAAVGATAYYLRTHATQPPKPASEPLVEAPKARTEVPPVAATATAETSAVPIVEATASATPPKGTSRPNHQSHSTGGAKHPGQSAPESPTPVPADAPPTPTSTPVAPPPTATPAAPPPAPPPATDPPAP